MTFDRRRSELRLAALRRLDLPRVYHENQFAELDAHNYFKSPAQTMSLEAGSGFFGQNVIFHSHISR